MSINFRAIGSSAWDEESGILIPTPRMEPATLADGAEGVEWQYEFSRNRGSIGSTFVRSTRRFVDDSQGGAWVFAFDLTAGREINAILDLKKEFSSLDDDFSFIRDIAKGLLTVFAGTTDNLDAQRRLMFTTVEALAYCGVHVAPEAAPDADGRIVLAELFVPAHPLAGE